MEGGRENLRIYYLQKKNELTEKKIRQVYSRNIFTVNSEKEGPSCRWDSEIPFSLPSYTLGVG